MQTRLEAEVENFSINIESLKKKFFVKKEAEFAFVVSKQKLEKNPVVDLTIMAVTHGNELAGIAVINRLIEHLLDHEDFLSFNLGLVLANTPASFADVRFREKDLNRSFDFKCESEAYVVTRAKELEPMLERSKLLVDIHQTIEASDSGFFIFPFSKGSFELAHALCPSLPIVTHWGAGFSKDGKCTDEYVNEKGGIGLTLELGQKGFDLYQESLGFSVVMKAFSIVEKGLPEISSIKRGDVFSWSHIEPYPEGNVELLSGLVNFQKIEKNQLIYKLNGEEKCSPVSGILLFPKYISKGAARPKELYRIMKSIDMKEIIDLI